MDNSQISDIEAKNFLEKKSNLIKERIVPGDFLDYENNRYRFLWILNAPNEEVLNLRNSKKVLINMLSKTKISIEDHEYFLDNYISLLRIDFLIKSINCDSFLGGVNIVYKNNLWQIGKYIGNEKFLRRGIAKKMTIRLIEYFKQFFPEIKEIFSITKSCNKVNIALNQKIGFFIFSKLENEFILMKKEL